MEENENENKNANTNQKQEPEVIEIPQKNKINFFKKVWYSIAKPSKYEEMRQEGVGVSIKYFFAILGILAVILTIFASNLQVSIANKAVSFMEENLPEMTFKDNKLSLGEKEEATILDDAQIIENFGNVVVINPLLEKKEAIKEYGKLASQNKIVVFLSEEYLVINRNYKPESETEEGIETHKYADESSKFIKDNSIEYNKQNVISYLKESVSFTYYFSSYFTYYFLAIGLIYIFYIILISLSLWLVTKMTKQKWSYKKSIMNVIYSLTLSIIVYVAYMIISYFAKFRITFIDIISIVLIFLYIFILLYKEKNAEISGGNINANKEG